MSKSDKPKAWAMKIRAHKSFHREGRAWSAKKLLIPAIALVAIIGIGFIYAFAL